MFTYCKDNKKMNSQSQWNERIEKVVRELEDQSKLYKIIHLEKANYLSKIYNRCMLFAIFLSPLATTISGIGMVVFPDETYIMAISTTLLTFLSGIVLSYIKYSKVEELSTSHSIAASKYTSLEKNIHRQLLLYKSDRISSQQYLQWLTETFDELLITSPLIHDEEVMWMHFKDDDKG